MTGCFSGLSQIKCQHSPILNVAGSSVSAQVVLNTFLPPAVQGPGNSFSYFNPDLIVYPWTGGPDSAFRNHSHNPFPPQHSGMENLGSMDQFQLLHYINEMMTYLPKSRRLLKLFATDFDAVDQASIFWKPLFLISCTLRQLLLESGFLSTRVPETGLIHQVQTDEKLPLLNWKGLF